MEYGFTCNFFLLQIFTFLDFSYLKTSLERNKNFRRSRGVAVRALVEICVDDISAVLRATDLSSITLRHLGWINAPHTQNFEISRANSGVKKY
jgi:hypothetical protein